MAVIVGNSETAYKMDVKGDAKNVNINIGDSAIKPASDTPVQTVMKSVGKSKRRRHVNKNKRYHFRAIAPGGSGCTRSRSISVSNVAVADIVDSSAYDRETFDSKQKYDTYMKDFDEEKNDDFERNDFSSDTTSETGKLAIDETRIDDEFQNEHEKQIQKIFEVTCDRFIKNTNIISQRSLQSSSVIAATKTKDYRFSSNSLDNSSKNLTSSALSDQAENFMNTNKNKCIS
ncbi:unnamed protein product [Rotaria sordida]|uniref:Uncharacterized protein n=1 Tax=Rotaria sordida TaxID=392033 RepID=A0A819L8H8_9BILA|nr:unnamed protein product [Rotaria sordida]CAF3962142.1 unnamed protein product [Rotaria sordida]